MKLKISFFLISLFLIVFACKKDEENTTQSTESNEELVKSYDEVKSKPARSEKQEGDVEVEGEVYTSPENVVNGEDEEINTKLNLLVSPSSNTRVMAGNANGWRTISTDGSSVSEQSMKIYIFSLKGDYVVYDAVSKSWSWGYYYVNKTMTKIVFDVNTDFYNVWTNVLMNASEFSMIEKGVNVKLIPFVLSGVKDENVNDNEQTLSEIVLGASTLKILESKEGDELDVYPIKRDCELIDRIDTVFYEECSYSDGACIEYDSAQNCTVYEQIQDSCWQAIERIDTSYTYDADNYVLREEYVNFRKGGVGFSEEKYSIGTCSELSQKDSKDDFTWKTINDTTIEITGDGPFQLYTKSLENNILELEGAQGEDKVYYKFQIIK